MNQEDLIKRVFPDKDIQLSIDEVHKQFKTLWPEATAKQIASSLGGAIASGFLVIEEGQTTLKSTR